MDTTMTMDAFEDVPFRIDFSLLDVLITNTSRFITSVVGFVSIIIFLFISIVTAMDIAYITIPYFQEFALDKGLVRYGGTKKFEIKLISADAFNAVEEKYRLDAQSTVNYGNSIYLIYLKKRFKTYLRFGIIFFILLGGPRFIILFSNMVLYPILQAFGIDV